MKNLAENLTSEKPKNQQKGSVDNAFENEVVKDLNSKIIEHEAFEQLESILNNPQSLKAMASNKKTVKVELTENQVYNLNLLDKLKESGFSEVSKTIQSLFFSFLIYSQENGDGLNLDPGEIHDVKTAINFFAELKE